MSQSLNDVKDEILEGKHPVGHTVVLHVMLFQDDDDNDEWGLPAEITLHVPTHIPEESIELANYVAKTSNRIEVQEVVSCTPVMRDMTLVEM